MDSTSSNCEGSDEPGPGAQAEPDLRSLNQRYSTGRFFIARCRFGLGVFARRDLAPGEMILPLEGPLIDFAETTRRGPRECMAIQIGPDRYIDTQPPGVWVNHSCDPNTGIKADRQLVAIRPIRKGEEICYDYSTTMEEASFTMECLCGAPACRKVVRDFSTLSPSLQQFYASRGIVMRFIAQPPAFYAGLACAHQMRAKEFVI